MKKTLYILFFLFPVNVVFGQDHAAAIKADADKMVTAFIHGDLHTLLDYTYPPIFEIGGGREFMEELIAGMLKEMQEGGYVIDTATVGLPGPVFTAGNELHAIITQTIYSSFPGGTARGDSPLLAISQNNGESWYFIDVKQLTPDMIAFLFPDFNYSLVIPESPAPVITLKDENQKEN